MNRWSPSYWYGSCPGWRLQADAGLLRLQRPIVLTSSVAEAWFLDALGLCRQSLGHP